MKFDFVKKIYEKIPIKIKFAFLPLFVKVIADNPVFKKTCKDLEDFSKLEPGEQDKVQFEKLKETLIYAYNHVPYYKQLFEKYDFKPEKMVAVDEIKNIPVLTKEKVVEAAEDIYSDEEIPYYTSYTGGSSGKALKCLLDKDSYYKERAFFTHFLEPLGYDPKKSRTVSFIGHNKGKEFYFSPIKADLAISPFRLFREENFEDIFKLISDFKPDFITCYASAITYFAKLCKKYNKMLRLKGVVFTSENWTSEDIEIVQSVFKCKVVSTYGHTERAVFGYIVDEKCIFDKLYGYTELIPTDIENEFQIACTGFISHKMPLIRYVTDDVIQVQEDGSYKLIGHRKSEVKLIGKNGFPIFKGAMTLHMAETQKVRAYQYVQNEIGKVELHIVEEQELTKKELENIKKYIDQRCEGLLDVEIKIVHEVRHTPRGKYIWAICNIEQ